MRVNVVVVQFGFREKPATRDPSLRLENGYALDDAA
jgi:hypothetical protein